MNKKHEYADFLIAIAEGKNLQIKSPSQGWIELSSDGFFEILLHKNVCKKNIRVKPDLIKINGFEFSKPLSKAPEKGTSYYVPCMDGSNFLCRHHTWTGKNSDWRFLKRGLVHLDEYDAAIHTKALIRFTGKFI